VGVIPYVRDELVKLGLSDKVLKVEQEVKALLIRNAREGIIGILALKIHNKLSELVVIAKVFNGISQRLPSNDSGEVAIGFTMDGSQNPSLEVHGPAFVQPEMLPRAVGDQIATPAVSQLMRNDIDVLAILNIWQSVSCG
jgi:hypothetical protein